jgi:dipeptidyl aminopeptidase/acylaminoacyl peptidase
MSLPLLLTVVLFAADALPQAKLDPAELGIPFHRYTTTDSLGRTITFYLSRPPGNQAGGKLPIALLVQGSGCQSLFQKRGEMIYGSQQNLLLNAAKGRVRVLAVEKPGVKFLDAAQRPGGAEGASEEFLKEHTLPRWAEANRAALLAAWTLPDIDRTRTLVVGHSEGGIVVARVAALAPEVTHVASMSGGGPTQLFSLAESRSQSRAGDQPGDAARRVQAFFDEWAEVQKDPESISRFWLGHPYRRWSSFLATSVTVELLQSKARVFLAQGALDKSVPPTGHDVLVAELRAQGRDVTAERIEDADHGFRKADEPQGSSAGMQAVFGQVVDWFLK